MNYLRQLRGLQQGNGELQGAGYTDSGLNQISLEYTYGELQEATQNFDASRKLGSGSYGGVFRGILKDGTEVAIKALDLPEEAGFEEEVKVLSKFRHPNLVILMGFARHVTQRLLVYEHLAGGDVHKRLQRSCVENIAFTYQQRVAVALDAACGLSHLHHATPKVFHRDIKSPNILLDKNGTAKMADFGLACLSHASAHKVKQASGTVGYACPLYVQRGVVTQGSEVYSFGMVLLELLTASPPAYLGRQPGQIQYLAHHINGDIRVALSMVDSKANWPAATARAIAELAMRCTQGQEQQRPGFLDIVRILRSLQNSETGQAGPVQQPAPAPVQPYSQAPLRQAAAKAGGRFQHTHQPQLIRRPPPHGRGRLVPGQQTGVQQKRGWTPAVAQSVGPGVTPQGVSHFGGYSQYGVPAAASPGMYRVGGPPSPAQVGPGQTQQATLSRRAPPSEGDSGHVLCALECIFAETGSLRELPIEKRCIVHSITEDTGQYPPLRVGRVYQTAFFDNVVQDEDAHSTISREHFVISIEEVTEQDPSRLANGSYPQKEYNFIIYNISGNGTHVNRMHLKGRGEKTILHHGDVISLARTEQGPQGPFQVTFLQFHFDLSDSFLCEGDDFGEDSPRSSSDESGVMDHRDGNAIEYVEGYPVFVLEVCGPGVHEHLPLELRRIVYSPPKEIQHQASPYSSLIVGRATQLEFWQNLLRTEAFNTLSRQHFEIQTWRGVPADGASSGIFSFLARNLSETNQVHVSSGPADGVEDATSKLAKNEQRHLLDGDWISLNLNQDHAFHMVFRDLTKSTSIAPAKLAGLEMRGTARWRSDSFGEQAEFAPSRTSSEERERELLGLGREQVPLKNGYAPTSMLRTHRPEQERLSPLYGAASSPTPAWEPPYVSTLDVSSDASSQVGGVSRTPVWSSGIGESGPPGRIPAQALRPSVSLANGLHTKDEEDASTIATPTRTPHEDEDDEDNLFGGVTRPNRAIIAPGGWPSSGSGASAVSVGTTVSRPPAGGGGRSTSPSRSVPGGVGTGSPKRPNRGGTVLVRDARGVREDHRVVIRPTPASDPRGNRAISPVRAMSPMSPTRTISPMGKLRYNENSIGLTHVRPW